MFRKTEIRDGSLIVSWQADDGYISSDRPQSVEVDLTDLVGCTEQEIRDVIEDYIMEDFTQKVSPDFDIEEILEVAMPAVEEMSEREMMMENEEE